MSNFQIILTAVFIAFVIFAVMIFSGAIPIGNKKTADNGGATGKVVLWGTIKKESISSLLDVFNGQNKTFTVAYVAKNPLTFDRELIEALASGVGPDMILLPNDLIIRYANKLFPIPYTNIPEATFRATYAGEGDLYLGSKGILGLPLTIDPIVMYYNQSLFEGAGIAKPPETWDDIAGISALLTKKDSDLSISQSTVALGEFDNVNHAKEIISMLLLQFGNPIVSRKDAVLSSTLGVFNDSGQNPAVRVLDFYTAFSNPTDKTYYSWNKGLPNAREQFIAGKLAIYFGYASELFTIQSKNPNLAFNVAKVPQLKNAQTKITYGAMNSLAILKTSKNPTTAYIATTMMSGADFASKLAVNLSLPPARRDLLANKPQNNAYVPIFFDSALIARGWLDPMADVSTTIFRELISNIKSGRLSTQDSLGKADGQLAPYLKGGI
jgi:ABC-type glycerol-3-phosphate transport system substrate-binding protein